MGTDASASRLLSSWQPVMEFTAPTTMYRVCPHATRIYLYIAPIVVSRSGVAMARTILHSCAKHPRHSTAHHHGWFFCCCCRCCLCQPPFDPFVIGCVPCIRKCSTEVLLVQCNNTKHPWRERERQEQDRKKQCNLIRKTYACSLGVCMSTSIQIVELSPSVWGIFFFSSFIAVRFTWHCEKSPTLLVCHHSGIAETRFTTLSVYCNSLLLATDKLLWFLDFGGNFLQREQ